MRDRTREIGYNVKGFERSLSRKKKKPRKLCHIALSIIPQQSQIILVTNECNPCLCCTCGTITANTPCAHATHATWITRSTFHYCETRTRLLAYHMTCNIIIASFVAEASHLASLHETHKHTHAHKNTINTETHKQTHTHKYTEKLSHIHTHLRAHTHIHTQTHQHTHTHKHTITHPYTQIRTHTRTPTNTHTLKHTNTHAYMQIQLAQDHKWVFTVKVHLRNDVGGHRMVWSSSFYVCAYGKRSKRRKHDTYIEMWSNFLHPRHITAITILKQLLAPWTYHNDQNFEGTFTTRDISQRSNFWSNL